MRGSSPVLCSRSITSPWVTPTIPNPRLMTICTSVTRNSPGVLMVSLRGSMLSIRAAFSVFLFFSWNILKLRVKLGAAVQSYFAFFFYQKKSYLAISFDLIKKKKKKIIERSFRK